MKTIISVLFVSIVVGTYAFTGGRTDFKAATPELVQKQKLIFELLQHPYQPGVSVYKPELFNIVQSFDFEQNFDKFSNVEAVKEFFYFYNKGLMPFNELFSIYNEKHRMQAIALFHVFYYAKDFETFYKTLVWARYNVNPGLFVYALHVAMVHRNDFAGMQLPAIYEIFPHYFFTFDVMQRAQLMKQQGFFGVKKVDDVYTYVVPANYSDFFVPSFNGASVTYFTEDIGLNAYYYYFHIDYPFWMGGQEYNLYKDRRGEYFFFYHQQLLARYYMERLSSNMGKIEEFSWYAPMSVGSYKPQLSTYNGYPFVSRDDDVVFYDDGNYFNGDFVNAYENRFLDAIDSGLFLLSNGTYFNFSYPGGVEYLGNLLQGNADSLNYKYYNYMFWVYKTFDNYFGKSQFGQQQMWTSVYPNVLAQPETTLRDPLYWSFMKKVFSFYYKFMQEQKPYTFNEINYDGVNIDSVNVDKLVTYFDYFDADISNAVNVESFAMDAANNVPSSPLKQFGRVSQYHGEDFMIKARQWRLNHVPFKVSIKVMSKMAAPSVVRIYLGPKYDEYGHPINVNENRFNFFLLDVFKYDLVAGNNVIVRDSQEFFNTVKDRTTYFELYKELMWASTGQKPFQMDNFEAHNGFPNRLILPKGTKGGMTYQMFVHIAPYHAPEMEQWSTFDPVISTGIGSGSRFVDNLPFYYPLDREINEYYWYTPNMFYQDVNIYHKTETEINSA